MSAPQDEGRAARIQKYKEERRQQLAARTAVIFSANVTERRPRKAADRSNAENTGTHLKSSSELNLNAVSTSSTSMPIRTTRTSRLRAAASSGLDTAAVRKSNRSSSVSALANDAKTKTARNSKIDRDKPKNSPNTRLNNEEKENLKSASTTCFNDIGAITKPKHSMNKNVNLEKDKNKNLVNSCKVKDVRNQSAGDRKNKLKTERCNKMEINHKSSAKIPQKIDYTVKVNKDGSNELVHLSETEPCSGATNNKNAIANKRNVQNEVMLKIKDYILDSNAKTNTVHESLLKNDSQDKTVKDEVSGSVVPIVKAAEPEKRGHLGVVCVRKVERFSELLSNLCSPCDADLLFEDIFAENGLAAGHDQRTASPAVAAPCRRAPPTALTPALTPAHTTAHTPAHTTAHTTTHTTTHISHTTSTPKRTAPAIADGPGTASKTRNQRPSDSSHPKTENLLQSSKSSTRRSNSSSIETKNEHLHKLPHNTASNKNRSYERRRSSDTTNKPSFIPLSKRSFDKDAKLSPNKKDVIKNYSNNSHESQTKPDAIKYKSPSNKCSSDSETIRNDRRQRAQKDSEKHREKYHYSNKRLTSLENSYATNANDVKKSSPKEVLNGNLLTNCTESGRDIELAGSNNLEDMSTLHETVRPHPGSSRLSQEMDSLAALTKQTLDRVNKLSNNLGSNKINLDTSEPHIDSIFSSTPQQKFKNETCNFSFTHDRPVHTRGVSERLKDIDAAAQHLIDFEKQSAMFSDLNNDISSQNRRQEIASTSYNHTPVSILKRKSIHEDNMVSNMSNQVISSPPVTFSPSVIEPRNSRCDRQRQGILKKRRSLDESQVARRRSYSPEVSFADDGSSDTSKPILKNRRSSLEDVIRNRSPDGQIQGILKRKPSKEEDHNQEDISYESPEPHGILKRKSNSSSSSSTTSCHVSIAQAVLLAAAGGAEIVDDEKEIMRPILKKRSFSEEHPCPEVLFCDTPKPILKKKSFEHDEHDIERPKKPILKTSKKLSGDDGHASSFDLSEDDRSSRRPSLLRSRTSDHSGSECETTVKPILKQRGSSLTRERSQSPRPRLSFCADSDTNVGVTNFSSDANDLSAAGPSRILNSAPDPEGSLSSNYPSAVLRRRDLRPKNSARSKSLACDVNDELLSILNSRRLKVERCENGHCGPSETKDREDTTTGSGSKQFPSIADRIKTMEQSFTKDLSGPRASISRSKPRDRDRFKTQPITVEEMRSAAFSLEPGQTNFQAFSPAGVGSFPSRPAETSAGEPDTDPFAEFKKIADSPPFGHAASALPTSISGSNIDKRDSCGEATFLDFESGGVSTLRRRSALDEIEKQVDKVRVALDEDCRALEEDERQLAETDNWSLNVSCDSGVYNRASSRDSGPHSGEELGLIESQEIKENHTTNSSSEWSPTATGVERGLLAMSRERRSTEMEHSPPAPAVDASDDEGREGGFTPGLVKSNSVVARASMWQQMQQQAKGLPRPLLRHNRSKNKEVASVADRFKTQPITWNENNQLPQKEENNFSLSQSKSSANVLDRDEDAKLDEDDPAKMSLMDKMKMFNAKLTHKPPVAGVPKHPREERAPRASRLKTMPVLASQVQEAMQHNERMAQSMTQDVPRNDDFQRKMELFRSASARNTSLEYIMRQNAKNKSLDLEDERPSERAQRMITPEVRGILKSGATPVPKTKTLAKGESSEGLKDEGIDSSSDDDSASARSVSSSEDSCSSSDSSEEIQGTKTKRFHPKGFPKNNMLKSSRTDSDLTRFHESPRKIQMPCAAELKERLGQVKRESTDNNIPVLGKLRREASKEEDDSNLRFKRLNGPVQLGKLRRPADKVPSPNEKQAEPILKISSLNQEAKNKFFGLDSGKNEKTIEELTAAVRKYIPPTGKCGSGSDGESSGGREVRRINCRPRHRVAGGIQRSATHADMPQRGGTIAERLAALQEAGANNWRTRKCRLSPDREDVKAIEIAKNRINETLNTAVDEKKKVQIDKTELGTNILSDTRTKLETASQQWRARVPQNDASLFTVAGRLERDKVTSTPPVTPPPAAPAPPPAALASPAPAPAVPTPNKFRARKLPPAASPTNGFASGPLRSASCAVVSVAMTQPVPELRPLAAKVDREPFKRSHSVSESISRLDEGEEKSGGAEKTGCSVHVPRADDETFHAFYLPVLEQRGRADDEQQIDLDLDAIDSASRQMLSHEWSRRAKRERRRVASRNPLRALAARTDLRQEYSPPPSTGVRERLTRDIVVGNCSLAAEALAALATKEDFSNVALRSAAAPAPPVQGTRALMLLHVKGRRRVQTRLVEPVHTNVNRGDCFILITPDQLFLYIGLYSNVIEKNRSTDIATHILNNKDLGCKNALGITTIDEQIKNYNNKQWNQFWSLLGVTEHIEGYTPTEAGHPDEDEIYESCIVQTNMCYEVLDEELIPIQEYWGQVPKIAMLQLSKVIVFDFGSELYIWYGKNVPLEHRRRAAQLAQDLFDNGYNYEECHINPLDSAGHQGTRDMQTSQLKASKTRPEWAILSKVTQHMESILFREKFLDWPDYTRVIKVKLQDSKTNSFELVPCDAEEMRSNEYEDPDLVLDGTHIGRGTHYYDKETMRHYDVKTKSLCKWVIQEYDYQKVENESEIGEFFSGDSYIFRWEYQITVTGRELNGKPSKHNVTGRDRFAYFCWQGKDASSNEKGAAALLTVELDKEKGPQIRVAQGNEPPAFLNLFQGNLVIHQGKKGVDKSRYKLFVTRGNVANEAYLLQVPCSARQLRSRGSLLLTDTLKNCLYIWHGSRSLKHTKSVATELANRLVTRKCNYLFSQEVKITEVREGEESKEVLEGLGSNKQVNNSLMDDGKECSADVTPRLFHFTDLSGQFEANEVLSPLRHQTLVTPFPFEQKELYSASQPALFLLDAGGAAWVWAGWCGGEDGEGGGARWQALRVCALRTAAAYWAAAGAGRPGGAGEERLRLVAAGLEPRAFTDLFDTWQERDDAAEANIEHGYKAGEARPCAGELSRLTSATAALPLSALQRRPLPDHLDAHRLERHLNPADFLEAFGMSKEEFAGLPAWKQTNMKKDLGLF